MTKAEIAANEIYKDGIRLVGRRDRNNNIVIHPETMVGILRNAVERGYQQAENDIIAKAAHWISANINCKPNEVEDYINHFKVYMKE